MRTLETEGVRIEMAPCDCGAVCTDEQAIAHLREWDRLLHLCVFCGGPIRITSMKLDHVHKSEIDEEGWGVTYAPMEYEPHWDWGTHMPFGWIDIRAHVSCAKKKMPYANFEETVYGRPQVVPEGYLPEMVRRACKTCGEVPTKADAERVAGRVYSFLGPCVYCGQPIRVSRIDLFHGSLSGKHTGAWHFEGYKREAILGWQGFTGSGQNFKHLEFNGHFHCAMKAMPYVKWSDLEWVIDQRKKVYPGLVDPQVRRFVRIQVGKEAAEFQTLTVNQIDHMVQWAMMDLEGPREWVPGLKK